jgi:hypothetical protein
MLMPLLMLAAALQKDPDPVCTADARWASLPQQAVNRTDPKLTVTLFTAVSRPGQCFPAEIRLTVTYFNANDQIICSGVVEGAAFQGNNTQITNLEIRPLSLLEFVRWTNGSREQALRFKRLSCKLPDGLSEAQSAEMDQAVSLRIYATVIAPWAGLATSEMSLRLLP